MNFMVLCKSLCHSVTNRENYADVYGCHFLPLNILRPLTRMINFSLFYLKDSSWWHHVWWLLKHAIRQLRSCQRVSNSTMDDREAAVLEVEGQRVSKFFVRTKLFPTHFKLLSIFCLAIISRPAHGSSEWNLHFNLLNILLPPTLDGCLGDFIKTSPLMFHRIFDRLTDYVSLAILRGDKVCHFCWWLNVSFHFSTWRFNYRDLWNKNENWNAKSSSKLKSWIQCH